MTNLARLCEMESIEEYRLVQPVEGVVPESIEITVDGEAYRYSDYQGKARQSRINPDVLVYGECERQ